MINTIVTHVLDLLAKDPGTFAGGTVYPAGWLGVSRVSDNGNRPGFVNIFDGTYEPSGADHRPAVYIGSEQIETYDRLEMAAIANGYTELRVAVVPLVICAAAADKRSARQQRDQLRANIRTVLQKHISETGYWYECLAEAGGGQLQGDLRVTASGGGTQRVAEATSICPLQIRYYWQPGGAA